MCSRISTGSSTADYLAQTGQLRRALDQADAVIVGAGAGLSTSAGLTYSGERFQQHFADFIEEYRFSDMYSAGFYPYATQEEYWAYWSRHIYYNRYDQPIRAPYQQLLNGLQGKDYFVITTNVDHCFQHTGFDKKRLFYTQGDYGLWQCSVPCRQTTYDNEDTVRQMLAQQKNLRVPTSLVPKCPVCGAPMTMNLRSDNTFVQDEGWHQAASRYGDFLRRHKGLRILFLELGVGNNTPGIIKYPFWQMTHENPKATYACINLENATAPREIGAQSICIEGDIEGVLREINRKPIRIMPF